MLFSWFSTIFVNIYSTWAKTSYLDEAFLAVLFLLLPSLVRHILKMFISAQAGSKLAHQLLTETLYNKSLNCNKSVLSYVREAARTQELKAIKQKNTFLFFFSEKQEF